MGREAVDTEARSCKVVPQQWTAPDVQPQDRRRLDIMVYSNRAGRHALMRCDFAILVSPLTRTGFAQACSVEVDGTTLQVAERREPRAAALSACWCWGWKLEAGGALDSGLPLQSVVGRLLAGLAPVVCVGPVGPAPWPAVAQPCSTCGGPPAILHDRPRGR